MIKKALLLFWVLTTSQVIYAQTSDSTATKWHYMVGFNATLLMKQLINFGANTNIPVSPYGIVGNVITPKGHTLRAGFGISYTESKEDANNPNGPVGNKNLSMNYRVGYEYFKKLNRRWTLRAGGDVVYGHAASRVEVPGNFDTVITETKNISVGGGPEMGIFFHIARGISLGTESSMYFTRGISKSKTTSLNNPIFNDDQTVRFNSLGLSVPTSIFLLFRF